ncbi:MAG: TIGR02996 domain-containing protein [Gemmataceae bacterium]
MGLRHPSADAFVRGILDDPADRLRRLVFADWLDEQGGKANAAWAGYLRAQAEWETLPADDPRRMDLLEQAKWHRRGIRARLTLPARAVRSEFLHLWKLLPFDNVRVRLSGEGIPQSLLQLMPESVAREHLVLPVGMDGYHLAIATPTPRNRETRDKLEFILNKTVVMFLADADEVQAAISRQYGQYETESFDTVFYEFPQSWSNDGEPRRSE